MSRDFERDMANVVEMEMKEMNKVDMERYGSGSSIVMAVEEMNSEVKEENKTTGFASYLLYLLCRPFYFSYSINFFRFLIFCRYFFSFTNRFSDFFLSYEYLEGGELFWSSLTILFTAIPISIYTMMGILRYGRDDKILLAASIMFGFPNALLVEAWREKSKADKEKREGNAEKAKEAEEAAQRLDDKASIHRFPQFLFNTFPQLCVQLYILATLNSQPSDQQIMSIITSCCAVSYDVIIGLLGSFGSIGVKRYNDTVERALIFRLLFCTWLLIHILVFVPSFGLFSSVKNQSDPSNVIFLLYFFIHLFLLTFAFSLMNGTTKKCNISIFRIVSISLQLLFCFSALFCTSSWVSVALFVNNSTLGPLTNVIFSPLQRWVGPNISDPSIQATDYSWAICDKSTLFNINGCLTESAAPFYSIIFSMTCSLFIYHCILVAIWRSIDKSIFRQQRKEKKEIFSNALELSARQLFFRRLQSFLDVLANWFSLLPYISTFVYIFDVYSDLALSITYFSQGEIYWGTLTITFFSFPIIFYTIMGFNRFKPDTSLVIISCFFGLPNALKMEANNSKLKGDADRHQNLSNRAHMYGLIATYFESFPQFCLQLYIAGYQNQISILQAVSIIFSFVMLARGTMNAIHGYFGYIQLKAYEASSKHKLIFFPWLTLHAMVFIPSLILFSSLKNHSHPAATIFILYFFIHLFASTVASFLYPINGATSCVFMKNHSNLLYHLIYRVTSILNRLPYLSRHIISISLQFVFCVTSLIFASLWFVSVGPYINHATLFTNLIWPETPSVFQRWIGPNISDPSINTSDYTWAICREESSNSTLREQYFWSYFQSQPTCLTKLAALFYSIIFCCSIVLFIYHCGLVFAWPILDKKYFHEITKDNIFYWKELIDRVNKDHAVEKEFKLLSLNLIKTVKSLQENVTPELKQDLENQFRFMDERHFLEKYPNVGKMMSLKYLDEFLVSFMQQSHDDDKNFKKMLRRVIEIRFHYFLICFHRWDEGVVDGELSFLRDLETSSRSWMDAGIFQVSEILTESRLRELESALSIVAESERKVCLPRYDEKFERTRRDVAACSKAWEQLARVFQNWFQMVKGEIKKEYFPVDDGLNDDTCVINANDELNNDFDDDTSITKIDDEVNIDNATVTNTVATVINMNPGVNNNDDTGIIINKEIQEKLMEDILKHVEKIVTDSFLDHLRYSYISDNASKFGANEPSSILEQMLTQNVEVVLTKELCERMKCGLSEWLETIDNKGYLVNKDRDESDLLQLKKVLEEKFISTLVNQQRSSPATQLSSLTAPTLSPSPSPSTLQLQPSELQSPPQPQPQPPQLRKNEKNPDEDFSVDTKLTIFTDIIKIINNLIFALQKIRINSVLGDLRWHVSDLAFIFEHLLPDNAKLILTEKFCQKIKHQLEKLAKGINVEGYLKNKHEDKNDLQQLRMALERKFNYTLSPSLPPSPLPSPPSSPSPSPRTQTKTQQQQQQQEGMNVTMFKDIVEVIDNLISNYPREME